MRPPVKRQHIKQTIQSWIRERGLVPGDPLPGQVAMARHFKTTPVTVVRALVELSNEGILHRINGKGTFVGKREAGRLPEFCLVLPEAHLDDPRHNPEFWSSLQTLQQAFVAVAANTRLFSIRIVSRDLDPALVADSFKHYEAVFFHHTDRPEAFVQYLIAGQLVPVVVFGQPRLDLDCLTVDHNPEEDTSLGLRYLIDLGYRRPAYVGSREAWCRSRTRAYLATLRDQGLSRTRNRIMLRPALHEHEGEAAVSQLLARHVGFDAVFCASDTFAKGVLCGLAHAGKRVPEDVGVMGFGGVHALVSHPPHLTTVNIPLRQEIRAALDAVAAAKPRLATPRQHIGLTGTVIEGRTTRRQPQSAGSHGRVHADEAG